MSRPIKNSKSSEDEPNRTNNGYNYRKTNYKPYKNDKKQSPVEEPKEHQQEKKPKEEKYVEQEDSEVISGDVKPVDNFEDLIKNENLLRGIYGYGFEKPSRIQSLAVPPIITGRDVIAQSQAGTGKTGAFTVGVLSRVDETKNYPQAIIVSNTRELSDQINSVVTEIGKYMGIQTALCIGGVSVKDNMKALETAHVIIATPGRLADMIKNDAFDTGKINIFVMDEADELLKDEFLDQSKNIILSLPKTTQICLFSATFPDDIMNLAHKFMNNPTVLLIKREKLTLDLITQWYIDVQHEAGKLTTIRDLYSKLSINQCIIYVNSISRAEWLKTKLEEDKHIVEVIHSGLQNAERISIMKKFRNSEFRVLIATDLMCRGIDIQQVSYVINYDLPHNPASYIHRIGRSGRFGKKGVGINFITKRDYMILKRIEQYYNTKIQEMPEPDELNAYLKSG